MSDSPVDVLTCPSCYNVISTVKTLDRPGDTVITCPSCSEKSPLSVFRTCKTKSVAKPNNAERSEKWQSPILLAIIWLVGVPVLLVSVLSLLNALSLVVDMSVSRKTASIDDVYQQLRVVTGLLQMLVFGKLIVWTFRLLQKNSL